MQAFIPIIVPGGCGGFGHVAPFVDVCVGLVACAIGIVCLAAGPIILLKSFLDRSYFGSRDWEGVALGSIISATIGPFGAAILYIGVTAIVKQWRT